MVRALCRGEWCELPECPEEAKPAYTVRFVCLVENCTFVLLYLESTFLKFTFIFYLLLLLRYIISSFYKFYFKNIYILL